MIADKSRFMLDYGLGSVWVCGLRWCGCDCSGTLHLILAVTLRFLGHGFACFALVLGDGGLVMMVFCCWDGIMSSRWCAVGMVWIVSSVSGSCLAALCLGWCWVSVGLCTVSGSGERVTGVDWCSSLVGRCVHSNFLAFHQVVFPWIRVSYWLFPSSCFSLI